MQKYLEMSRELLKLKFQGDFSAASDIILKAVKDKPKNKQIEILSNYLSTSYLYVNALEMQLTEEYKKFYLKLQSKTI